MGGSKVSFYVPCCEQNVSKSFSPVALPCCASDEAFVTRDFIKPYRFFDQVTLAALDGRKFCLQMVKVLAGLRYIANRGNREPITENEREREKAKKGKQNNMAM